MIVRRRGSVLDVDGPPDQPVGIRVRLRSLSLLQARRVAAEHHSLGTNDVVNLRLLATGSRTGKSFFE